MKNEDDLKYAPPTYANLNDVPAAAGTGWAQDINHPDSYAVVLEDAEGKPFATATYTFKTWIRIFNHLREIHERETGELHRH